MMPSVSFLYPQFLILMLLLPVAWRLLTCRRLVPSAVLRMAVTALAVLALARPRFGVAETGVDVIVVVDRSASCADEAGRAARELTSFLWDAAGEGDRVAVVGFGDGVRVERSFSIGDVAPVAPEGFENASQLADALGFAAGMRSRTRRTAVLAITDGEFTGGDPADPASLERLRGTPFWYRRVGETGELDVAAGEISLPETVEPRSAWLVRFSIHASAPVEAGYVLSRSGLILASGKQQLKRGVNHLFARDTADREGFLDYRLDVSADGDAIPANNRSAALLAVEGMPRTLLVSANGDGGLLARSLEAAAIPVDVVRPENAPDAPAMFTPYRLVALENCRLSDFSGGSVRAIAGAVEAGLTSLLVTGGQNSFGAGGYHRSALDPLLPVEMEIRSEIHRSRLAVALALDRSGSMAAGVGGGRTKMDLANLGAAESIRLLSPGDEATVIAVDTAPHIVFPLSRVDQPDRLASAALRVRSMGGGIYCYTALKAAEAELEKSRLPNRHIILFADASDAEEQRGCIGLARDMANRKISLSVIALGTRGDSDAAFLAELARAGDGEALFADSAASIPRLFTQELVRVSRRGFIEEEIAPRVLPAAGALGVDLTDFPALGGFNVAAARQGAIVMLDIPDEYRTPLLVTRTDGASATGAMLFEADGEFAGGLVYWPRTPELFVSVARSLAGRTRRAGVKAYSASARGVHRVEYEFSPEAAEAVRRGDDVAVQWLGTSGRTVTSELTWTTPTTATSETRLANPGHYLPVANFPGLGLAPAPSVTVSYSEEFAPRHGGAAALTLRALARETGGGEGYDLAAVKRSARATEDGSRDGVAYALGLALLLFLLELSGRRLVWFR